MLKDNNRNTRKRCKICSKLAITTSERRLLLFLLLTLSMYLFAGYKQAYTFGYLGNIAHISPLMRSVNLASINVRKKTKEINCPNKHSQLDFNVRLPDFESNLLLQVAVVLFPFGT